MSSESTSGDAKTIISPNTSFGDIIIILVIFFLLFQIKIIIAHM